MNQGQKKLRRRMFLGAMGLGLAAPLAFKMSRLAVAQAAGRPQRLLIIYIPHGMPDEHFMPIAGADGALNLLPSPLGVLAPLEPYKSYLTVLRGIGMNGGASNHAAIRATLTGFPEGAGSDSIDSLIANSLGVPSYALGTLPYSQGAGFYQDCFLLKQGTWVRPEADPTRSANTLFAGLDAAPTPAVDESVFRNEVMALTETELDAVQRTLSGLTSEESKLQVHLNAVRALKAQLGAMPPTTSCQGRPTLPAVEAVRGLDPLDSTNLAKLLDANLEIIGQAFACGTAKIVTLQNMYVNAGINMGFPGGPGIAKAHHDPISHSWDAAGRGEFATVQRWFYDRIATKLVKFLVDTDDFADGSAPRKLIDNTLICVCSEISDGANHNSDASNVYLNGVSQPTSLPFVLIGGGSGFLGLKPGGRIVDARRMHTDVLATLADAMGAPLTKIGSQTVQTIAEVKA
jgi:hypothetical protein